MSMIMKILINIVIFQGLDFVLKFGIINIKCQTVP